VGSGPAGLTLAAQLAALVPPDQYIAQAMPLGAHQVLTDFFAAFMLPN
jgi:hypothetical protein